MSRTSMTMEQFYKEVVEKFNNAVGELTGYDCPLCRNKGQVAVLQDGVDCYKACSCMPLRNSGKTQLDILIEQYNLDTFIAEDEWQRKVLESAKAFIKEKQSWYFIGGSVGTGKTHICTGIIKELADKGKKCRYMQWREESVRLKAVVNESEYGTLISPLLEADVLYIDDFFKGGITQGDINLAFEIINNRYNLKKQTIISSEKTWKEILEIDEAIGSRIGERANKYTISIGNKENYRLRSMRKEK